MRKTTLAAFTVALGLGLSAPIILAETLEMAPAPAAESGSVLPQRGSSMAQVESSFGAPERKVSPVGQPPISRWVYPGFVVYFEYSHVVHAVRVRSADRG